MSAIRNKFRNLRDSKPIYWPLLALLRTFKYVGLPIPERIYRHVPCCGAVRVRIANNGQYAIRSAGNKIENTLYWRGWVGHEPGSMREWVAHAAYAECVLDIGANSGVFALSAAAAGARAVHAFEPIKRVYMRLAENSALNTDLRVSTWQVAVGERNGTATIHDPGGNMPTSASLEKAFADEKFADLSRVQVKVVSIDEFCREYHVRPVDLIKIDVEGYEEHALRGMVETVAKYRPILLIEALEQYEEPLKKLVNQLWPKCYEWTRIIEGNGIPNRNVLLSPKG